MLFVDLVKHGENIPVATALAELRRSRRDVLRRREGCLCRDAECSGYIVGTEFANAWQTAGQTAFHLVSGSEKRRHLLFDEGLSVLNHKYAAAVLGQFADQSCRQRILRHLEQGDALGCRFFHVVVGVAAGNHSESAFRSRFQPVVGRSLGTGCDFRLL